MNLESSENRESELHLPRSINLSMFIIESSVECICASELAQDIIEAMSESFSKHFDVNCI